MTDSSFCQIQILSLEKEAKHVDEGRLKDDCQPNYQQVGTLMRLNWPDPID